MSRHSNKSGNYYKAVLTQVHESGQDPAIECKKQSDV